MSRRRITAFGASRFPGGEPADVVELARRLAGSGWDGMTGGHEGLMAAFARGMSEGGGHVRGVTLDRFPTPPGNHLTEEIRARDFFHRMQKLIEETDAYLVLPGGLGTLAELAMTWDLLAIRVLEPRPLVLFGGMWAPVVEVLQRHLLLSTERAFSIVVPCKTADEAIAALDRHG